MQDRPTAPELLDALAAYLFSELRPRLSKGERFQVLVAANLCAVLARELRAGAEPTLADATLFRSLLDMPAPAPEPARADAEARQAAAELAASIRTGRLDDRLEEVLQGLSGHVRRKLEIARPGYAD